MVTKIYSSLNNFISYQKDKSLCRIALVRHFGLDIFKLEPKRISLPLLV
jgi:hypothetical protein